MLNMARIGMQTKSGIIIKLTSETTQKLAEEEVKNVPAPVTEPPKVKEPQEEPVKAVDQNVKQIREIADLDSEDDDDDMQVDENVKKTELSEKSKSKETSSWGDYKQYITYEGDDAIYTDPSNQQKYTWCSTANNWIAKTEGDNADGTEASGRVYSYENDEHVYTDTDGSKFFYDPAKKAWIPKVDDDFLAYYQMSYGFVDNTTKEAQTEDKDETNKKSSEKKGELPGAKRKADPQWFDASEDNNNTKVYVSNLPTDLTEEEFVDFMQKCGLVMRDPSSQKMKIKLYMDKENNCFKGDALCTYIKIESVELALNLLDGSDLKGNTVKVERAHFQLKGEYNPSLKPKKKKKKELDKIKKMQEKLFDWRPEKILGERGKHEKVVIVKNLFRPSDFDKEVQLILDFQQDLREECSKCGEVRKVIIYDRHPEGVAQVSMKEPEQADEVIKLINNRWFGKRKLTAEIWDGRTKYKIAETDAEINQRIKKWDKFLEDDDKEKPDTAQSSKELKKQEIAQTSAVSKELKKTDLKGIQETSKVPEEFKKPESMEGKQKIALSKVSEETNKPNSKEGKPVQSTEVFNEFKMPEPKDGNSVTAQPFKMLQEIKKTDLKEEKQETAQSLESYNEFKVPSPKVGKVETIQNLEELEETKKQDV